ncbi:M23 family metallopeptidase [Arthrobacter sp. H14]|uniref:M23 family metallopeptidase n=1 Tax=Arthrobacter sp. H14 TaxID=1312959 RepID=UPI0004B4A210|nr:M23 family metallopeptidase [Arthrobacter sp. H14]
MHTGTDFAAVCDTPVLASESGTVVETGWHPHGGGNRVVINHGDGLETTYNHLSAIKVTDGQNVSAGHPIGSVGTTGNSTGCHLHFEVVVDNQTVDPAGWL